MYSRSYYADEANRVALPENYDGTAFVMSQNETVAEQMHTEVKEEKIVEASGQSCGSEAVRIPFLSSLFGTGGLGISTPINLGLEEILILATAAFLFFSKDGDKESALILLLLIFIK